MCQSMQSDLDFYLGQRSEHQSSEAMILFEYPKDGFDLTGPFLPSFDSLLGMEFFSYLFLVSVELMIGLDDSVVLGAMAGSSKRTSLAVLGLIAGEFLDKT